MNSTTFDRILRRVLIVPVLALLLGASAVYLQMHSANTTVTHIAAGDKSIAETLLIERLIIDQETSLRGYQTTADPTFLEPFHNARQQLPVEFSRYETLATTPKQSTAINELEAKHSAWEEGFALPIIATIQSGGKTDDLDLNLLGKRQMDDMRSRLSALQHDTEQNRDSSIDHWHVQTQRTTLALVLFALVSGVALGLYTRSRIQKISGAFRESNHALRVRAEQTFRSEQKLRTTLESIGDGVITCDAEGRVTTLNEVAQQLTGWSGEEALNQPLENVFSIINETTREPVENPVSKVKRLNTVVRLSNHTILIRRDGEEIYIDDSGAPIRDQRGNLIGVVLVFRDVSMAKKSHAALMATEKLAVAGRLAATIAHEIHNPLDSVSNLLFLMDGQSTPEESRHFLELAKGEIARVTQISRAMLSLYRESKAPVPIDLKEMLESILLLMDRRFHLLGVAVTTDLPDNLIIYGFPAELRQVFTNLLTNAAEASGENTTVHVCAEASLAQLESQGLRSEPGASVTISDQGPGIPSNIQEQLFQPFFTTKGERGTGLGLWVSRGIITKHGGRIDITSSTDPEEHGTKVSVFLATHPVVHASAA